MTTILDAPAMRAPLTALSPTPPAPKITTVSPALTFAVFKTAPAPVTTPQPSSAAWAKGISFGHDRELVLVDERPFGEAAQPEPLEQANPVAAQTRGIGGPAQRRLRMLALEGAARQTSSAPAARLRERPDDVISDTELRDVGTDCSHDSRDLVAEHRRRRNDVVRGEEQVGVTQPGRLHVDENFAPVSARRCRRPRNRTRDRVRSGQALSCGATL